MDEHPRPVSPKPHVAHALSFVTFFSNSLIWFEIPVAGISAASFSLSPLCFENFAPKLVATFSRTSVPGTRFVCSVSQHRFTSASSSEHTFSADWSRCASSSVAALILSSGLPVFWRDCRYIGASSRFCHLSLTTSGLSSVTFGRTLDEQ